MQTDRERVAFWPFTADDLHADPCATGLQIGALPAAKTGSYLITRGDPIAAGRTLLVTEC